MKFMTLFYIICLITGIHEFSEEKLLEYLQIFYRRFYSQQFKRSAMPDGPKVLDISLSPRTDWRMPSDADYRRRL